MSIKQTKSQWINSVIEFRSLRKKEAEGVLNTGEKRRLQFLQKELEQQFKKGSSDPKSSQSKKQSKKVHLDRSTPKTGFQAILSTEIPLSKNHSSSTLPKVGEYPSLDSPAMAPTLPSLPNTMEHISKQILQHPMQNQDLATRQQPQQALVFEDKELCELLHYPEELTKK